MTNKTQYKIIRTKTLEEMEGATVHHVDRGWQPSGPVTEIKDIQADGFRYYHEMVRFVPNNDEELQREIQIAADKKQFEERLEQMDQKIKDLLDINNIKLMFVDGKFYTQVDHKVTEGISPTQVLDLLKGSKHYPIDMDDKTVLTAVERLL